MDHTTIYHVFYVDIKKNYRKTNNNKKTNRRSCNVTWSIWCIDLLNSPKQRKQLSCVKKLSSNRKMVGFLSANWMMIKWIEIGATLETHLVFNRKAVECECAYEMSIIDGNQNNFKCLVQSTEQFRGRIEIDFVHLLGSETFVCLFYRRTRMNDNCYG